MATAEQILRKLQRLPFVFRTSGVRLSSVYVLPLNPEHYTIRSPTRGSVIQTLNSNFENFFGMGLPQGTLRGSFGFKTRPQLGLLGLSLPGQLQFKLLEAIFASFYNEFQQTVRDEDATWEFLDLTDLHFFKIRIMTFEYERSIQHQFLHKYNIQFVVIEDFLNFPRRFGENSLFSKLASVPSALSDLVGIAGDLVKAPTSRTGKTIESIADSLGREILGEEAVP